MTQSDASGPADSADRTGGWSLVAEHDGTAPLIASLLAADPKVEYTKPELSDIAGLPYKTLYLSQTVEALVEVGLLAARDRDGAETLYRVDPDSDAYDAAATFHASATTGGSRGARSGK